MLIATIKCKVMEEIMLTIKEQKRMDAMGKIFRWELNMAEAAMVLGISERQAYRIKANIQQAA